MCNMVISRGLCYDPCDGRIRQTRAADSSGTGSMCAQTSLVWLQTRASLLDRLDGDVREQDWEEFYEMYWRVIYGYGRGWGLSPDDAEDLVQEVMVTVLRRLPAFEYDRSRGRFLSWI